MSFDGDGQGATAPASLTGCVTERGGKYCLVVTGTNTEYVLTGNANDLKHMVGKGVSITGTPDPNAPSSTIIETSYTLAPQAR